MVYLNNTSSSAHNGSGGKNAKSSKKIWLKIILVVVAVFLIVGGVMAWKTGSILNKISKGGLLNSLAHSLPGANNQLKGEADGRVNILLLSMRGANDPAGGLLADSIEVLSLEPKESKASLIAVPRDLFVDNPASGNKTKLNAVYAFGEQKGAGQGITYMEQAVGNITGLPIQYGVSTNFAGFKQLIDTIGGVTVTLDKPFEESAQFSQLGVCDGVTFTKPSGQYQNKIKSSHTVIVNGVKKKVNVKVPMYPLCYNVSPECNGDFKLPAGTQTLDSTKALCYARSRETSNDFERAKRQQQIIQAVKDKLLSVGTLTDFTKLNGILNSLGDNVKTDMQPWEMKRLYDLYGQMKNYTMYTRVMDESDDPEAGLLYGVSDPVSGDILLPKGDNYDKIRTLFQNIFTLQPQQKKAN